MGKCTENVFKMSLYIFKHGKRIKISKVTSFRTYNTVNSTIITLQNA